MSRPSSFTQSAADKICERLAGGESLRTICKDPKMPSCTSVKRWLLNDKNLAFRAQYAQAREEQAEFYAEQIISISDEEVTMIKASKHGSDDEEGEIEVVFDSAAVARNRLRVDARKWYASKLAPKKWGEKLELSGDADSPLVVQVVKLTK